MQAILNFAQQTGFYMFSQGGNWKMLIMIAISFVALVLCCIGLTPYDKPENFAGLNKNSTPSLKEMLALLKGNKELRRYIVAASSDKLAQSVGGQPVITTLLFGVILGSMVGSSIASLIAMLPSIIFAIIGARMAGKLGNKAKDWSFEISFDNAGNDVAVQFPHVKFSDLEASEQTSFAWTSGLLTAR